MADRRLIGVAACFVLIVACSATSELKATTRGSFHRRIPAELSGTTLGAPWRLFRWRTHAGRQCQTLLVGERAAPRLFEPNGRNGVGYSYSCGPLPAATSLQLYGSGKFGQISTDHYLTGFAAHQVRVLGADPAIEVHESITGTFVMIWRGPRPHTLRFRIRDQAATCDIDWDEPELPDAICPAPNPRV